MDKMICIEFFDHQKLDEYFVVSEQYWCLWDEHFLIFFPLLAKELIRNLSEELDDKYGVTVWKTWDLYNSFSLSDYGL